MRIGMSISSSYSVVNARDGARHMIERARAAYEAGLDHMFIGDHHVTPSPYYQNTPMIARMLAEWPDRPFWRPLLAAALAPCSAGGANWHPGRNRRRRASYCNAGWAIIVRGKPMGIDMTQRVGMFEASLNIMKRLWSGETVSEGRYWNLVDARIAPAPPEAIEVWIGAVVPPAIERTARLSAGWLAAPSLTLDEARDAINAYRDGCAEYDQLPSVSAIRRDVLIGPTSQEARALAKPYIHNNYRGMNPEALMVGSPAEIEEEIGQLAELGFTDICARNITADQDLAIETINRLGGVRASILS